MSQADIQSLADVLGVVALVGFVVVGWWAVRSKRVEATADDDHHPGAMGAPGPGNRWGNWPGPTFED